jgi:hypothetical protein
LALLNNPFVNQGSIDTPSGTAYGVFIPDEDGAAGRLQGNCQKAIADQAFQFLSFGLAVGTVFLCFLFLRNGRPGKSGTYV